MNAINVIEDDATYTVSGINYATGKRASKGGLTCDQAERQYRLLRENGYTSLCIRRDMTKQDVSALVVTVCLWAVAAACVVGIAMTMFKGGVQ